MLSKRARNVIEKMGNYYACWDNPTNFQESSREDIITDFRNMKDIKKLCGAGPITLDEILELHKLLNELWG